MKLCYKKNMWEIFLYLAMKNHIYNINLFYKHAQLIMFFFNNKKINQIKKNTYRIL